MASADSRKTVAFDSNILLLAARDKIDVFALVENRFGAVSFVVPEQVLSELSLLAEKKKALAREFAVVKKMLEANDCRAVPVQAGNADDALFALSKDCLVFSSDRLLGKRIKNDNGAIIYLRKKRLLESAGLPE
ncbi:MAG: hypothetical protein HY394_00095 [Candidatus Diapherotrites archaeon]|nr:hypothetical protein [Candidatus Diapherotrites archaeon]